MAEVTKKEQKLLDTAMKRLKLAVTVDAFNRDAAIEDLKFANGDQWDPKEKKRRSDKGRPALTLNLLPKFIDQVVGDMLHNTPSIKVRPENSRGDINIAKIRQGIISSIEYLSNSKGIYGYAGKQMVTCGYGGWRVLSRYTEDNPFLQEIYIEGIRNPFLIYMDPSSKDQNYADAKWGFLLEKMPKDEFEERFPDATATTESLKVGRGLQDELWYDGDNVTVAEYFTRISEKVMMYQLEDGRVVDEDELATIKKEWKEDNKDLLAKIEAGPQPQAPNAGALPASMVPPPPQTGAPAPSPQPASPQQLQMPGQPASPQEAPGQQQQPQPPPPPQGASLMEDMKKLGSEPKVAKKRKTEVTVIRQHIITAFEILEGKEEGNVFPGKFIPLVLLKGKELNIEGKNHVYSLIRNAKDPQKLINFWNTAAAETIALAPKAPWLMTPKQIEGHEKAYAESNIENNPVLLFNVDPDVPGPPNRVQPSQPPVAMFEQIRRGEENLKSVIGMFNADVGAPGSEQTGAAITARQKPGDIATFEFMENLARAILYTGRVINEMIPEVYDTERDVRIKNIDDTETFVPINTTVGSAVKHISEHPDRFESFDIDELRTIFSKDGKDAKYNDITAGKYSVVISTGPSYATQRQESSQHLMQLVQAMPQQMAIAADLLVQSMDFPDADELAARLRKPLVAQGIARLRKGEEQPKPIPPSPQVQLAQAKMQLEQGKMELQKLKVEQEKMKMEHEKIKLQIEQAKLQAELKASGDTDILQTVEKQMRLDLEEKRLKLEKDKFDHQRQMDGARHGHDKRKLEVETALGLMKNESV